jgi:hypothetical protein
MVVIFLENEKVLTKGEKVHVLENTFLCLSIEQKKSEKELFFQY